ncbi:hypothetical protein R1flu_016648 [Riccia fluitans]|uniref:Uncharacterized protein n=1 Tax=Riccia fluitans TaxID=41844 RepID=A0ABD1YQH7_9MARC
MAFCADTSSMRLSFNTIQQRCFCRNGAPQKALVRGHGRRILPEARIRAKGLLLSWNASEDPGLKSKFCKNNNFVHGRINCSRDDAAGASPQPEEAQQKNEKTLLEKVKNGLQNANSSFPYAIVASTALAFAYPPSFTWFTTRYYAPALGFLMFAVGVNLSIESFRKAIDRPAVIALGYVGQFVVKPLLGVTVASVSVSFFNLPKAVGSGLVLASCVSGAQLSNYATFLVEPSMAPLSIVMTALSTATAVVVTPALTLLLLGKRLPVDVPAMMASITQIVLVPIAGGLVINKFLPSVSRGIRPFLPISSVLVTCACIGAPLAHNINALRSPFGFMVLLPVFAFHALAFVVGYKATEIFFPSAVDLDGLAKTISFETGMQSGLLGLALANKFFEDPLVGIPCAISTVLMSLIGFALTIVWHPQRKAPREESTA